MLIELDEVVEIFPKLIIWNKLPEELDEEIIIKFLRNDFLILEYDINQIFKTKNKNIYAYVINLDDLLFDNDESYNDILKNAENILNQIYETDEYNFFIFSTHNFNEIKNLFLNAHIKYFEIQNKSKSNIMSILNKIVEPNFIYKFSRTNLRLFLRPYSYKVVIKHKDLIYKAFIKDLSLSSLGIIIDDDNDFKKINIGDFITIRIDFKVSFLVINNGVIVRKDKFNNEIGIKIDIMDKFMIDENNSILLENIINTWLTKIVQSKRLKKENIKYLLD